MRLAPLAALLLLPAAVVLAGHGHGGGSHGGGSHGGGSHGGGSHIGRSHGGCSHRGGSHRSGGGRGPVVFGGPYWGGWGVYGDYYGPGYGPAEYDEYDWATVDIDVSPLEAHVYLEGRYIGAAYDFDGDPDYLHLRPGAYTLEFRLEGYESVLINIDAEAGARIEVHKRLHRIPGAKQDGSSDAPRPVGGVLRYWGMRHGSPEAYDGEDRRRPRNEREPGDIQVQADRDEAQHPPNERPKDSDQALGVPETASPARQQARLQLSVQPADAVVYLDDRFLGTGEEVGGAEGLTLTVGKHTIVVLRPGFKARKLEIEAVAGESERIGVSLEN